MRSNWKSSRLVPFLFSLVVLVLLDLAARAAVSLLDLNLDIAVVHPNLGQKELNRQIYVSDRFLLWRMKPDIRDQFVSPALAPKGREPLLFRVVTNSRGYQGPEFAPVKPKDSLRVVCMGNSSTFGWGVPPDSTYPRLLQAELEGRLGREVEVINAGVPGYSSIQGLALLEREVRALSPDVITLSFGANDAQHTARSDREIMREREGLVGAAQEVLSHSALYSALRYAIVTRKVERELARSGEEARYPGRRALPVEFRGAMTEAVARGRQAGAAVFLVELMPPEIEWDPYRRGLLELSAESAVPIVWTNRIFNSFLADPDAGDGTARAYVAATRQRYGEKIIAAHPQIFLRLDRVHPNALGHMLIARALADTIANALITERAP
jgi:lysophospholipase L1-like esterase